MSNNENIEKYSFINGFVQVSPGTGMFLARIVTRPDGTHYLAFLDMGSDHRNLGERRSQDVWHTAVFRTQHAITTYKNQCIKPGGKGPQIWRQVGGYLPPKYVPPTRGALFTDFVYDWVETMLKKSERDLAQYGNNNEITYKRFRKYEDVVNWANSVMAEIADHSCKASPDHPQCSDDQTCYAHMAVAKFSMRTLQLLRLKTRSVAASKRTK